MAAALDSAASGDTIKLMGDIDYNAGIVISGKTITFDLNDHTLNVTNSAGHALEVGGGGVVSLAGSGALNVTSTSASGSGVYAHDGGKATVTNATATGNQTIVVYANHGEVIVNGDVIATGMQSSGVEVRAGEVIVNGDVSATGTDSVGVWASDTGSGATINVSVGGSVEGYYGVSAYGENVVVTIAGNVTATGYGVYGWEVYGVEAQAGEVIVNGDVSATGTDSVGVWAYNSGTVTIEGTVAVSQGSVHIKLENSETDIESEGSWTPPYRTYTDGSNTVKVRFNTAPTRRPGISETATASVTVNQPYNLDLSTIFEDADGDTLTYRVSVNSAPSVAADVYYSYTPTTVGTTTLAFRANDGIVDSADTYTVELKATSGGSGSGRRTRAAPAYSAVLSGAGGAETTLPVTVNTNKGSATTDLGTLARDVFSGGGTQVITVPSIRGVNAYMMEMPATSLSGSQGEGALTFATGAGSITIPADMLAGVPGIEGKQAGITIGQGDRSGLPDEIRAAIGDRPIVQLTLTLDGERTEWNNPDAPVTVSIPYTPSPEELEDPEHITVWYIDGAGNVVSVPSGRYDPETGTVMFTVTHFSEYAVVYVQKTFSDLADVAWAKDQVEALASKGILRGVTETEYQPAAAITRADYLYFLVRTLGVSARFEGNFEDIPGDAYYFEEIGVAGKLGITNGVGENRFDPSAGITRQDMITLTERALRMLGRLTQQGSAADLERFSDRSSIAPYAVESFASLVKQGLIQGDGDQVNPLGNTTRAEAAVFLYRIYNRR